MSSTRSIPIDAEPYAFEFRPEFCALLIIDMQRDFLEPGGFGEMLGNDVAQLRRTIAPNQILLAAWRAAGLTVLHTREGHRPDLSDLPLAKKVRGRSATCIGAPGPMGRILIRGEPGHEIVPELAPLPSETVIDKPGKGAFWATGRRRNFRTHPRRRARVHRAALPRHQHARRARTPAGGPDEEVP